MGKSKLQLWGSVNYGASTFFRVEKAETELFAVARGQGCVQAALR